jgi:predicted Zn-dependent peptidase
VDTRHGIPANYGMTTSDWITRGVSFVQVRAPNGNLDNALAILLDHVRSLHLDDGVRNWIDREYRPIYRQEFERPSRAADRTLWGTVYGSHPLGRAVTPDAFDRVSSGDVQRWIDRAFTPGNSVLVVAGDLDLDKAERAARAWFEGWDPRPDGRPFGVGTLGSRTPDQPVPIVRTVKPGARQVDVELACAIPLQTPRDRIAAQLVASRMERRMHGFARKGLGSTYGIGARLTIQPAILQLSLGGSIDSRGIARILALLRSEADNLGKAAPDPEDLARTQWDEGLRASIAYESSGTMGLTLARLRLAGLPAETLEKFPDELMKTTGADVQRVAAECRKTVASLMGEQGTLDRLVPAR